MNFILDRRKIGYGNPTGELSQQAELLTENISEELLGCLNAMPESAGQRHWVSLKS